MSMCKRAAEQELSSCAVLSTFNSKEATVVRKTALEVGVCVSPNYYWSDRRGITRLITGRQKVTRAALQIKLAGNEIKLERHQMASSSVRSALLRRFS